jgi:hypothetical protein
VTTIEFAAENPGGIDMAYGFVKIELDTGTPGPGHYSGGEIAGVHKFNLDAAGEGSIDLVGNDVITPEGSVWRIDVEGYKVALSVPNTGGPYSWADPDLITTQNPPVILVPGEDTNVSPYIDPAVDFLAANDGITDDSAPLQAAIDEAVSTGVPIVLTGEYLHATTLEWTPTGPLTVYADGATITYSGSGWQWDLDRDSQAAGLPRAQFFGGVWIRPDTALGSFNMHDVRGALFDHVECECNDNAGTTWHVENEGTWSERNEWLYCSSRNHSTAIHLDCYEATVTHKATASLVATLTIGTHPFQVGNRVIVELDTPDADYDGTNQTITAVTATTISYATTGGDEGTTAATGTVYSKGSFARTNVTGLKLQGGVAGEAHIDMHPKSGPYDSKFDGIHGNIAEDSIVFRLTGGALGGTSFSNIGVERQSSGTVYMFDIPTTWTGRRPVLDGSPRLTSNEFDPEGVALYATPEPDESPWFPHTNYGGIDTDAYIEALLGIILRISTTHPVLADWPSNPAIGTVLMRDGNNGTPLVTELVARTSSGFRTAALLNRRTTSGTAAPTDGTWTRGDICHNSAPSVGAPSFWQCVTTGTPGTWAASPNLV